MREWLGTDGEGGGDPVERLLGSSYAAVRSRVEAALVGLPQRFERPMVSESGELRYTSTDYVPRIVAGRPSGFYVLVTDISRRVLAEDRQQEEVIASALLEERARLAVEMQDAVLQHLFAAGLALSLLEPVVAEGPGRSSLDEAVSNLESGVSALRSSIERLDHGAGAALSTASIERVVAASAQWLTCVPTVKVRGPLDRVPERLAAALLGALTQAMSNVVRHADAGSLEVRVQVEDGHLDLVVVDDGRGLPDVVQRTGLDRQQWAVERLGGSMTVAAAEPRGTCLRWSVPLERSA
jgi:signal transduction histidine kinase